MRFNILDQKMLETYNKIDKPIQKRAGKPVEEEIYQARWVWYHTILAFQIFMTNVLLVAILVVLIIG